MRVRHEEDKATSIPYESNYEKIPVKRKHDTLADG